MHGHGHGVHHGHGMRRETTETGYVKFKELLYEYKGIRHDKGMRGYHHVHASMHRRWVRSENQNTDRIRIIIESNTT